MRDRGYEGKADGLSLYMYIVVLLAETGTVSLSIKQRRLYSWICSLSLLHETMQVTLRLAHKNRPLMPGHQLLAFKPSETSRACRAYIPLAKRKFWRFWQLHSKSLLICALCKSDKVVGFNAAALLKNVPPLCQISLFTVYRNNDILKMSIIM